MKEKSYMIMLQGVDKPIFVHKVKKYIIHENGTVFVDMNDEPLAGIPTTAAYFLTTDKQEK